MPPILRSLAAATIATLCAGPLAAQFFPYTIVTTPNTALGSMPVNGPRVDVIDLDGDPYPDIVTNSYFADQTAVFRNLGAGGPGFDGGITIPGFDGNDVFAADLNGDGLDDFIQIADDAAINQYSGELRWSLNTGAPPYFPAQPTGTRKLNPVQGAPYNHIYKSIAFIQLDGDADPELAVGQRQIGPGNYYYIQFYDFDPASPSALTPIFDITPAGYQSTFESFEVVDIDGDGDQDILNCRGPLYRNDSVGQNYAFTTVSTPSVGVVYSVESGDLNGDGRLDFGYTAHDNGPELKVYLQEFGCGANPYSIATSSSFNCPGTYADWLDIEDLDGDGRDDIVFSYSGPGYHLGAIRSVGDGTLADFFELPTTGQPAQAAGLADFDLDGDIDIVTFSAANLDLFVNESSRSVNEVFHDYPTATNAIWVDGASTSSAPDGSWQDPYPTIAGGIGAATAGDAVLVRPGTYTCDTGITIHALDDIQLLGVNGPSQTFLFGIHFELSNGARISGFRMESRSATTDALVTVTSGEGYVVGNELFGSGALDGIRVATAQDGYIASNIVHGFRHGIDVQSGSSAVVAEIYSNTLVGNGNGICFGPANVIKIINNLIVDNSSYGVRYSCSGSQSQLFTLEIDYNWVDLNGMGDYVTTVPLGSTCGSQTPGPGPNEDPTLVWDMNEFVDAAGLDFHLQAGSRAVDVGSSGSINPAWLGIDVDGDPRSICDLFVPSTSSDCFDIGADEVAAQSLELRRDPVNFILRTSFASGVELTQVAFSTGIVDVPLINSLLLLEPTAFWATYPIGVSPGATHTLPREATLPGVIPIGARFYAQSVVLGPTGRVAMTNPITVTYH